MDFEDKQRSIAKLFDGEVVDDTDRVAVCIKGVRNGLPIRLEAFMCGWPFSVSYAIETNPSDDPDRENIGQGKVSMVPRLGRGLWSFFAHTFLFEDRGMSVNDKRLEKKLIFNYDYKDPCLRVIKYPGMADIIMTLEDDCKMKEMIIKTDQGVYFSQGVNFESLDLDLCQATFNYLGEITKVLTDLF